MKNNTISICIGSYGSYAECNKKALGSKWFDLSFYHDWGEITDELTADGWELDGIDEELFIQDSDGADISELDAHPSELLELLQMSEIFEDDYKFELMEAYTEIYSFSDWLDLVRRDESGWHYNLKYWSGSTIDDVAYDLMNELYEIPENLKSYIDYNAFARDLEFDGYHETSNGVLYAG